jgi:hypothetical protein
MVAACAFAAGCVVVGVGVGVTAPAAPHAGAATVATDRAQLTQVERQLAVAGEKIQHLVSDYDSVELRKQRIDALLRRTESAFTVDRRTEAAAAAHLRAVAVSAYVSGGSLRSGISLFGAPGSRADLASVYIDVAGGALQSSATAYQVDRHRAFVTAATLQVEQSRVVTTLHELVDARHLATTAVAADQSLLVRVKGNLHALLVAAYRNQQAADRAAERALAVSESQQPVSPPPPPTAPAITAAPGSYANPLRAVGGLTPERIDQGVDYSGYGPIYAIGDGVVLGTTVAGWPGGTFISYRLTDGPAAGLVVYAAEDIEPLVQPGQVVNASTVLGTIYEGPDGIETGWSDPAGQGWTMAHDYGQFSGANSTAFGANFSQLLQSLGAPGGILQNAPPTGALPPGWPSW